MSVKVRSIWLGKIVNVELNNIVKLEEELSEKEWKKIEKS
ncbi:MAG: hypothetical protein MRERC_2c148 [Mycoplasmataceae bacterium RC_NB112A]|nr:MAG: hypothetical protein MRERC_2c148 [Mycoplasmataceae bacterium RC_NB112A]